VFELPPPSVNRSRNAIFADHASLEDFLRSEMEAGILDALQEQVVNGDGTGENLTGILATSGIISQAFATDRLASIRKGLTQLQATGVTPNALVLNPADLEALDLLRADGATGAFLLGDPSAESASNIWPFPVSRPMRWPRARRCWRAGTRPKSWSGKTRPWPLTGPA
jgi:HK97 family phage major capsid protein